MCVGGLLVWKRRDVDSVSSFDDRKRSRRSSLGAVSRTMSFPPARRCSLRKRGSEKRPRVPFEKLAVSFDIDHLEYLLCEELAVWNPAASNTDVGDWNQFQGLAQKCHACNKGKSFSSCASSLGPYNDQLEQVVDWLCRFLEHPLSSDTPPLLLAQVHTAIGLIRQAAGAYDAAKRSHLHAAWILSHASADEIPYQREHLSVTLYRLGTLYGRLGKHKEMHATLRRAFDVYAGANNNKDDERLCKARSASSRSASSSATSVTLSSFTSSQQLCTVQEEDENDFLLAPSDHERCGDDAGVARVTPVLLTDMENLCR